MSGQTDRARCTEKAPSVLIPLAPGCEELEAVTIIDLLRRAAMNVRVVGLNQTEITASRGVRLIADYRLDDIIEHPFDLMVMPGGMPGAQHLANDERILQLARRIYAEGGFVAAICAAPKVLWKAGLLKGRKATSFPGHLPEDNPAFTYLEDPIVTDGRIVTSRGPGTAMDFTLHLIALLLGQEKRIEVESLLMRPQLMD